VHSILVFVYTASHNITHITHLNYIYPQNLGVKECSLVKFGKYGFV